MNKTVQLGKRGVKLAWQLGLTGLLGLGVGQANAGVNMATLDIDWSNAIVELEDPNTVFTWSSQSQTNNIGGHSNSGYDGSSYGGYLNNGGWGNNLLGHSSSAGNGQTNNLTDQGVHLTSQTNNLGDLNNPCGTGCTNYANGSVTRSGSFTITGSGGVTFKLPYTTTLTLENLDNQNSYYASSNISFSGNFTTTIPNRQPTNGNFSDSKSFSTYFYNPTNDVGTHSGVLVADFAIGGAGKNPVTTGSFNFNAGTYATSLVTAAPAIAAAVPEPETYAMMMAGLGLVGVVARRRKQLGTAANAV